MGGTLSSLAEARKVNDRFEQKLNDVYKTAQPQLSLIQDHFTYNLSKEFARCAYECFDRSKKLDEIDNCVEHCKVPIRQAKDLYDSEMGNFHQGLSRTLKACIDKAETSKQNNTINRNSVRDLESCLDQAIQDGHRTLSTLLERLKNDLSVPQ